MIVNEKFGIPRMSVTGSMLQNTRFMQKNVRLLGKISKNCGDSIEVNCGDNVNVVVRFVEPPNEPLEGIIDIQGKVVSRNVVEADSYIVPPPSLAENFDLQTYCEAVTFIGSSDNPWSQADS